MSHNKGWVGFDLDGTLATYDGWKGATVIGEPVPAMVEQLKKHVTAGDEVRIFTARIYPLGTTDPAEGYRVKEAQDAYITIQLWCRKHLGQDFRITCVKDFGMWLLYDDRCKQVEPNTGRIIGDQPMPHYNKERGE